MSYLRRFVWFAAKKLVLWTVALGVLVCAFFMCMNTSNVYIVLTDGLENRVNVILTGGDAYPLTTWFHPDFLANDPALIGAVEGRSIYSDYNIRNYDYELKVSSIWAWPWDRYASCTVTETVTDIDGSVKVSRADEVKGPVPQWQSGRFNVTLVREANKWKIIGMQQTAVIAQPQGGA